MTRSSKGPALPFRRPTITAQHDLGWVTVVEHLQDNGDGTFRWTRHAVDGCEECSLCGGSGALNARLAADAAFPGHVEVGAC